MTYFKPADPKEDRRSQQGEDVPNYCKVCGASYVEHKNGKCPQ